MKNKILLLTLAVCLAACASSGKKSTSTNSSPVGHVSGSSSSGSTATSPTSKSGKTISKTPTDIAQDYVIGDIHASSVAGVPDSFSIALRKYLKNELNEGGRLAPSGSASRTVDISLSEFRGNGDVAGDHVTSSITVKDKAGHVVGESKVNSSSNVLDAGDPDALAKINAAEIARFLMGAPLKR